MALPITVVIPTYNRAELLRSALASVAAQVPEGPAEVLVVDDCSTEDVAAVAAAFDATVIRHEVNRGEAHADNTGISAATQPWVAFLDSDDEWLPSCLDVLWRARDDHVLVAGKSVAFGTGPSVGRVGSPASPSAVVLRSPADLIFPTNIVASSGVMARRDILIEAGCFNPALRDAVDLDLWLRVLERGTGIVLPEVVVRYRVHAGQATANRERTMIAHERVLEAYRGRGWWSADLVGGWRAIRHWDDMRDAISERRPGRGLRALAGLVGDPRQWRRLYRELRDRRLQRQRLDLAAAGEPPPQ